MRIKSMRNLSELASQSNPGTSLPQPLKASILNAQPTSEPRRVCIAFEHTESGSNMISWAAKHCLFPDDDIRLVHCTNRVGTLFFKYHNNFSFEELPNYDSDVHVIFLNSYSKQGINTLHELSQDSLKCVMV